VRGRGLADRKGVDMSNLNQSPPTQPQPEPAPAPGKPKRPKRFGWPTLIITAMGSWLIGLMFGIAGEPTTTTAEPTPTGVLSASSEPSFRWSTPTRQTEDDPTVKPKPAPAKPTYTKAQEQAIGAAEDYLEYSAFSRKGLIKQLSSDAGEGFSKADATFAVDHIKVYWKEQAAKSAKEYLEYSNFSRSGLIHQLESDAGEGFTHSQAVYGVNKAGL
jgi:hypothetical protein